MLALLANRAVKVAELRTLAETCAIDQNKGKFTTKAVVSTIHTGFTRKCATQASIGVVVVSGIATGNTGVSLQNQVLSAVCASRGT